MIQWLIVIIVALFVLWIALEHFIPRMLSSRGGWPSDTDVRLQKNPDGVLEIQCDAPDPRMLDQLVRHLKKRFTARVIYQLDSPTGEIIRRLEIDNQTIEVYWREWGEDLTVHSVDPAGEPIIKRIAASIENELKE